MGLTTIQVVLWCLTLLLELLACAFAFRRRLYLQLPIFTTYLTMLIVRAAFIYVVYRDAGYGSRFAFYSYWITEAVLLAGRASGIGELTWKASRPYPGFRVVLKCMLAVVTFILLMHAAVGAILQRSGIPAFVLTLERDVELTAAAVLVVFLALTRLYDVPWRTLYKLVAAGLIFYSLVQVANNEISRHWMESHFHWWEAARSASFDIALVIWLIALARPSPARHGVTQVQDLQPLREFVRQGTDFIQELSARLHHFRKTVEK